MAKTLTVYLAADLRKFNSGLDSAKGQLKGFDDHTTGFAGKLNNVLGPALIGAGVAAAAFATKLAVDGVQAAMAEEAELAKLNTTLSNLGFAGASQSVNTFIDDLQYASAVADTDLRNAFDRIVRSTRDVGEAQRVLKIALDASAGSGKSLQSVADALGKAYDGNTTGLGKLGIGLDKATLASGNLELITAKMADTFAGQAQKKAETLAGRIDTLKIAADELKEAFGQGLIGNVNDSAAALDKATKAMRDAQPAAQRVGGVLNEVGYTALGITDNFIAMGTAISNGRWDMVWRMFTAGEGELAALNRAAFSLGKQFEYVQYAAYGAAKQVSTFSAATVNAANSSRYTALAQQEYGKVISRSGGTLDAWKKSLDAATDATGRGGSAMSEASKESDKLKKAFDAQKTVVDGTNTALEAAVAKWNDAKQAVTDYAKNMSDKLLGGIDLGGAFEAQFDEAGKRTGKTLIDSFDDQIKQAEWFANVLKEIKRQGADQSLIEQVASLGPSTGGALGQQMINEGLVPTINDKWTAVRSAMQVAGASLVPEALLAGQTYAASMVTSTAAQLKADQDKLKKIGKSMGEIIGVNVKAEIAAAVAEAIAAAEAARNAAAAQSAAQGAQAAVAVTQQSAVQVLNQVINNSNNRTGYTTAELYQMGVLH